MPHDDTAHAHEPGWATLTRTAVLSDDAFEQLEQLFNLSEGWRHFPDGQATDAEFARLIAERGASCP